jgi:hypothetical protein
MVAGKWRVLARLPDVSADAPARSQPTRTFADNSAHDYRFDPPQTRSIHHTHDGDHERRTFRRESPILPRTDPFAIGSASTMETWGPVLRFVLLFALFTAAGVILLAGGNDAQPSAKERLSADSSVTQQKLEPAATLVDAPAPAATAAGPTSAPGSDDEQDAANSPGAMELAAPTNKPAPDDVQARRGSADENESPYPDTGWPQTVLPDAGDAAVPRVQTTDVPQAVAQLPGFISEIPQRHASHDDNQPGLH